MLAAGASPRLPVAIRIALRDLFRYRARSGAALAATTFAVFLAMAICLVASFKFDDPLNWSGPNLSSSQLDRLHAGQSPAPGMMSQLSNAQVASLSGRVNSLAASLHAQSVLPLESAGAMLYQAGAQAHNNFPARVYVATPQLLATYGIKASQIAPGTDVLTMRPGLAGLPHMEMSWRGYGQCSGTRHRRKRPAKPPCTLSNHCLANPAIQTVGNLPGGTSAPNTVITEYAVSKYHLQPQPDRLADPGTGPAHRHADQRRAAVRARLRGDGRDQVRWSRFRRDRRRGHRARHRDRARRAGRVRRPDPQRDRAGPAHAHRDRGQRHDAADDHRGDRRRAGPARRDPRHGCAVIAGLAFAHGSLSAMFGDVR